MRSAELFAFMKERHAIHLRREAGEPKPWTKDPILQRYRFCNIYRELDKVTMWINHHWVQPHKEDANLWFAMALARFVNWPDTLARLGYPRRWNATRFEDIMYAQTAEGKQAWGGAYIVSTNGNAMPKPQYIARWVLTPMWETRKSIAANYYRANATLAEFHNALMMFDGLGSFMAAQVVADLKAVPPLRHAADKATWAASGPGSRRGLNRVLKRPTDAPWREGVWYSKMMDLKTAVDPLVAKASMPPVDMQNLQNCLCEFDKIERVRLGEGRPKALYPGV
jgi:hypothetical protein